MKTVELDSPWWGAAKRFNWSSKTPGLGVAETIVMSAVEHDEDIKIVVGEDGKYGTFTNNGKKAEQLTRGFTFMAKNVKLRVIPQNECDKSTS